MKKEVIILAVEDDPGHLRLLVNNLRRAGVENQILTFQDGQQIIDFLFSGNDTELHKPNRSYLLLLDIRMPKIDGIQVLERVKADEKLAKIPVIMLTTADDPKDIDRCYELGCNTYIVKPVDYDNFSNAVKKLGMFLSVIEIPKTFKLIS
jgi:CheY-like chemotaxis protein